MSRSKTFLALVFLVILSHRSAQPQQPEAGPENPPALAGSVTGLVVYAGNQLPARFAEIRLVPKPADLAFVSLVPIKPLTSAGPPQRKAALPRFVVGSSGMDGRFRLDGVPSGDYFVAALKPGYMTPGATTQMDASESELKDVVASLAVVHVAAGGVATANLTLRRGATISGRMEYADGSPAIGVRVGAEPLEGITFRTDLNNLRRMTLSPLQNALQSLSHPQAPQPNVLTDDEGRFRIFGLPPGKYIVSTMIVLDHSLGQVTMDDGNSAHVGREHMFPEMIVVYGPGAFRRKDAKVFEIRGDEQITDADLTIDPNGLHTLRGKVLAAEDHHAPTALIRLKEDGAKDAVRLVENEDDGSFQVNYLPSGKYTLEITSIDAPNLTDSADGPKEPRPYKTVRLTAVVGDQDVVLDDVLMTPLKPGEKDPDSIF